MTLFAAYLPMCESDKVIPIAVEFDATQLQKRLGAFLDPSHPALVKALCDNISNGALDNAAAEFKVLTRQLIIVHHLHTFGQVVGDLRERSFFLGVDASVSLARRALTIEAALPE